MICVCVLNSTLVYVEADASVRSYDDAEGKKQTRTNFTQRELHFLLLSFFLNYYN